MSNSRSTLTAEAALIYDGAPALDFEALIDSVNAAIVHMGQAPVVPGPGGSDAFVLMTRDDIHATVAIHQTPLGSRGFERALEAPLTRSSHSSLLKALESRRGHVLIAVGDGPAPLALDTPAEVPAAAKLELLQAVIRAVMAQARPIAAHLCTSDRFFLPVELDKALAHTLSPQLLIHPEFTRAAKKDCYHMTAHQSAHLMGATLVMRDIPAALTPRKALALADNLIRKHLNGDLPLAAGDRIRRADGETLHIRHVPNGQIVISFGHGEDGELEKPRPFTSHRGYSAVTPPPTPAAAGETAPAPEDEWTPTVSPGARAAHAGQSGKGIPTWMILVGVGVFLWVGLPLLNVPQKVIQSAFSNELSPGER